MVVSKPDSNSKNRKRANGWQAASRAEALRGGGVLKPIVHSLDGDGGILAPRPSFFDGSRKAGGDKYDPVMLTRGAFTGSSVLRFNLSLSDREETQRPYEENFVVRSTIRAFANGMKSLPFELWDGSPTGEGSQPLESHPLLDLLAKPNRSQSGLELVVSHTTDYKHDGEVFWFLMNAKGEPVQVNEATGKITEFPTQLLAVRGERVQHKSDKAGFPASYRYTVSEGNYSEPFPWLAVVPFIEYDPYNFVRGLGDVRALMREIDLMFQAYRYLDAAVKNGGDPGGFITFDETIGQDELDARQAMVDDTFTAENAGRYKILDRKAKFTPNPVSPKDMEYMSLFEWTLKAICSGVGVPPPIIGWYEDATYNNVDAARREMWSGANGILSFSAGMQDVIRTKLIPRLEGTPEMGRETDLFPFFNPSGIEVLKKDRSDQLLKAAQVAGSGVGVSFNEALAMSDLNVEPAESGDTAYVHNSLREVGEPSSTAVAMEAAKKGGASSKASERGTGPSDLERRRVWVEMPSRATEAEADPLILKRAKAWLDRYEKTIIKRLSVYANGGRKPSAAQARQAGDIDLAFNPATLTEADLAGLVLNEVEWGAAMARTMKAPIRGVWIQGLSAAKGAVGGPFIAATDPRVIEFISEQLLQLAEGVTSATSSKVRSAILRALTGADKAVSLREAIRQALPAITKELRSTFGSNHARALTISTTETNRATNMANNLQMGDAGVSKKRWRTNSSNVRPSHMTQQAAGEIDFDAKFPNGGLHPHDPTLPPEEVVNCICSLEAAAFEDDLLAD